MIDLDAFLAFMGDEAFPGKHLAFIKTFKSQKMKDQSSIEKQKLSDIDSET